MFALHAKLWNPSAANMQYLVRLSDRATRDIAAIYEFIHAGVSEAAFTWFNDLEGAIYSLGKFPERGTMTPENRKLRQLLFGKKPGFYRIIYKINKRRFVVDVLHIRHGARAARPPERFERP